MHKAAFINRPFNHYRKDNEVSLTRSYKPRLFAQWNELYDRMERYIKDNNLPKDFYSALDNRICFSMIGLGLTELLNPNREYTKFSFNGKIPPGVRSTQNKLSADSLESVFYILQIPMCLRRLCADKNNVDDN